MISQITGRLSAVNEHAVILETGALAYEVLVPTSAHSDLSRLVGEDVRLFTVFYLDGALATGSFVPRLVGFLSEADREFFHLLNKVKGVSTKKALRAMSVPAHSIARAIEDGDEKSLTALPEVGKRTAAQIVTELRGKLRDFLVAAPTPKPQAELTDAQLIALDILVQWGDRRADAQRWISAAVDADPSLAAPEEIVRAAYRAKGRE